MALRYHLNPIQPPQIGLVVLQSDESLERDMARLLPEGAEMLVTRVASAEEVSGETLHAMEKVLTDAARLLPRGTEFAALGYGCTSGAAHIGVERIAELVQAGVQTRAVTEPVSALIAACRHLGLSRIGLISPYIASVSDQLRHVLEQQGIEVVAFASFEEPVERNVVRIAPDAIADAAVEMGRNPDCEGVFLSCTNLRTLDIIEPVEADIDKPVLSSNQVLAWHLADVIGLNPPGGAPGRLFRTG